MKHKVVLSHLQFAKFLLQKSRQEDRFGELAFVNGCLQQGLFALTLFVEESFGSDLGGPPSILIDRARQMDNRSAVANELLALVAAPDSWLAFWLSMEKLLRSELAGRKATSANVVSDLIASSAAQGVEDWTDYSFEQIARRIDEFEVFVTRHVALDIEY